MFEPKKYNEIFEDMRERTDVLTDFEVGSTARTMYESFAYEIALLYEKMHLVYLSAYVDTAQGPQLDRVVAVLGIKRGLPDFAQGIVTFTRDKGQEDIAVQAGTLVATEDSPDTPRKTYHTIENVIFGKELEEIAVKVQASKRGEDEIAAAESIVVMPRPIPGVKSVINQEPVLFTGKRLETDAELRERAKNALISSGRATIFSIENAVFSLPGIRDVRVNENFTEQYGVIDVYVDSADLHDDSEEIVQNERERILNEIDQVRAAGVYVPLQSAAPVIVNGEFKIEADPDLKFTEEERAALAAAAKKAASGYIEERKMGEPLIFSQLTKRILEIEGVNDLLDFAITTVRKVNGDERQEDYTPSDKRIEAAEFERFRPGEIEVN